ncbi:MAG: hypothetical protein IKJ40_02140 [Bacteroidales bacterium]|nr:hypothetical protein [Bacteroidales bacterium]
MIFVADSGSTKTTWAVVETGTKIVTEGLNPLFVTDEQVHTVCQTVRKQFFACGFPSRIYFYGAGCSNILQQSRMQKLLEKEFSATQVTVETDMLGACRAVSDNKATLVGILGTGSNVCYYDGEKIAAKSVSLGYILGDEGSANYMGRMLLTDYLTGKMPEDIATLFHEAYPYSYEEWIDRIYNKPNANRFLASLARFATDHIDLMERENNIWYVVDQWHSARLGDLIMQTHCCHIDIVGGFAKAIESGLRKTLTSYAIEVGTIVADPIDGLIGFHKKDSKNS